MAATEAQVEMEMKQIPLH